MATKKPPTLVSGFCIIKNIINILFLIIELYSKSFLLSGGTPISSNSDMNNYTEIGNYYANSEIAQSLQNAPFNHSFTMKIDYGNGTGYICQTYREINTGRIAIRYNNNQVANTEQWQQFIYFSDDDTVLVHVISPVTMNDTIDINTGYVDLNFPLNEYFFFKFVCAAGNNSSVGNLYEERMRVGLSCCVPCGQGYIRFNIESLTRINILENTSGYNFRYIKALKK